MIKDTIVEGNNDHGQVLANATAVRYKRHEKTAILALPVVEQREDVIPDSKINILSRRNRIRTSCRCFPKTGTLQEGKQSSEWLWSH